VIQGQPDLYVMFLYRALRSWLKPGGRTAFIIPIAVLEADYAEQLRSVIAEHKLLEIMDLEPLRKLTFRGVKRQTVILVLENSPPSDDDLVSVGIAGTECYDSTTEEIDLRMAIKSDIPRRYLRDLLWPGIQRRRRMSWLTSKIQAGDVPILDKLSAASRLRDHVDWVYRKRRGNTGTVVVRELPAGANTNDWVRRPLFYMGLKLGSKAALTSTGMSVFKGLNVFPGGLRGAPMGHWQRSSPTLDLKMYRYADFLDHDRLFASREIAQLPTISPVPADAVFNNTVILIQMRKKFPLNGWVLARPIMFAAATCLRATIIEDLGCHWYPKNLGLIPVPQDWTDSERTTLAGATARLIDADENLADQWRHVDGTLAAATTQTVSQLIAAGSPLVEGFMLPAAVSDEFIADDIEMDASGLHAGGTFRLEVPNASLRTILWYRLHERLMDGEDVSIGDIQAVKIPVDPDPIAALIVGVRGSDVAEAFEHARQHLDDVAAQMLGLTDSDLAYLQERFLTGPFLSQIRPMWAHRGLHMQGYHDHSGGDRFLD